MTWLYLKSSIYGPPGVHSTATGVRWDRFYSSQQEMMFGPHQVTSKMQRLSQRRLWRPSKTGVLRKQSSVLWRGLACQSPTHGLHTFLNAASMCSRRLKIVSRRSSIFAISTTVFESLSSLVSILLRRSSDIEISLIRGVLAVLIIDIRPIPRSCGFFCG